MRKKRVILCCLIGVVLAFTAFLVYKSATAEPSYDGHPLSYWVEMLARTKSHPDREAINAINQIGVAALPFLVKWIQDFPPQWTVKFSTWTARPWLRFANQLCNASIGRANNLFDGSCSAFQVLGEKAMPAFDDLCRLTNETNKELTAFAAITSLYSLGTNAVPPLLAVAANTNHPYHAQAQVLAATIVRKHTPTPATNAPTE